MVHPLQAMTAQPRFDPADTPVEATVSRGGADYDIGTGLTLGPGGGERRHVRLNGVEAKGRPWPRDREGRPFSTCALAFSESWTEAR